MACASVEMYDVARAAGGEDRAERIGIQRCGAHERQKDRGCAHG